MTYDRACRLADSLQKRRKDVDPLVHLAARRAALPSRHRASHTFRSSLDADGVRRFVDDQGRPVDRKQLPAWIRQMTESSVRYMDLPGSFRTTPTGITFS